MTKIEIYDESAKKIEQIADENDTTPAEIIEALMEHIEEVKEDEGWQN